MLRLVNVTLQDVTPLVAICPHRAWEFPDGLKSVAFALGVTPAVGRSPSMVTL